MLKTYIMTNKKAIYNVTDTHVVRIVGTHSKYDQRRLWTPHTHTNRTFHWGNLNLNLKNFKWGKYNYEINVFL